MNGLELKPAETLLVARARDFLAAGPADVTTLIGHVCQLPGPPRAVAEHIAVALFAGLPEFLRDDAGRWGLATHLVHEPAVPWLASRTGGLPERLRDLSFAVVDVETTGGRAYGGDRITEVAAVIVRDGEIQEKYETLVNPERPIPPLVTRLTNITWGMVSHAPLFRDISVRFAQVLRGHVFVAHNVQFDWRFLTSEFARATGERLSGRRLCTVRLVRQLLPNLSRRSLDGVTNYYGVENTARHRAGGDAMATARVFIRLLREAEERGCSTWDELQNLLSTRVPKRRRRRRPSALPHAIDRDTTS